MMSIDQVRIRSQEVSRWLSDELVKIRTGRAAPALLDAVRVESYGSPVPIKQVGNVTVEDARTLRVTLWDPSQIRAVESAIQQADLGVSVSSDDKGVRVHFPELTTESRERIAKAAKQKHEEARISLRQVRDDFRQDLQKSEKTGDISEDESHHLEAEAQKVIDQTNKELDDTFEKKRAEIMNE